MNGPNDVQRLRTRAATVATPSDDLVRVYLIDARTKPWKPGAVNRAGGPPIGVDEHTRPRHGDAYMHHLITVDLDETPEARTAAGIPDDVRAAAVFIRDARDNDAFEPGSGETAVRLLTAADLARGEWRGPRVDDPPPHEFDLHPVDVPRRAFDDNDAFYDNEEDPDVKKLWDLHCELMSAERVGGPLITFADDKRSDRFLLQFSESVVDVNLGDAGTMYVFPDDAFWSCH